MELLKIGIGTISFTNVDTTASDSYKAARCSQNKIATYVSANKIRTDANSTSISCRDYSVNVRITKIISFTECFTNVSKSLL